MTTAGHWSLDASTMVELIQHRAAPLVQSFARSHSQGKADGALAQASLTSALGTQLPVKVLAPPRATQHASKIALQREPKQFTPFSVGTEQVPASGTPLLDPPLLDPPLLDPPLLDVGF
jgi:hypothetical protein